MQGVRFSAKFPTGFVDDARMVAQRANGAPLVSVKKVARLKFADPPELPPKILERRQPLVVAPVTPESLRRRAQQLFETLHASLIASPHSREAVNNLNGGDFCRMLTTLRELHELRSVSELAGVFNPESLAFLRRIWGVVHPLQEDWQMAMRSMLAEQPGYEPTVVCGVMQTFPQRYVCGLRDWVVAKAVGREGDIRLGDFILHPHAAREAFEIPSGAFQTFPATRMMFVRLALQFDEPKTHAHLKGFADAFTAVTWNPQGGW